MGFHINTDFAYFSLCTFLTHPFSPPLQQAFNNLITVSVHHSQSISPLHTFNHNFNRFIYESIIFNFTFVIHICPQLMSSMLQWIWASTLTLTLLIFPSTHSWLVHSHLHFNKANNSNKYKNQCFLYLHHKQCIARFCLHVVSLWAKSRFGETVPLLVDEKEYHLVEILNPHY